jgi:anti-sigma factor RsiW
MASEQTAPDDGPAPDPFEAELVAYLDGELDEAAARRVEARLARDPAARARAAELKKSFDLLDYLPRPEPSPTFATRTLEKLPAVRPGDSPPPEAKPAARQQKPRRAAASTSVPVPLDDGSRSGASRSRSRAAPEYRPERWPRAWIGGLFAAVLAFAAVGYVGTSAARTYLFPARDEEPDASGIAPEPRVVERLPLYAAADDIGFVAELAKPDYFGDDPAVAYDPTLKVPPADVSGKPTAQQFDALAKAFRALTPARQAEVVHLDRELQAKEPRERDRFFRVLEAYSAWLARLPDADRKGILAAPDAQSRLSAIRAARERQWVESLPPPRRAKLDAADAKGRDALVRQWKGEEAAGRDRWALTRRRAEALAANKSPWPFDTERGRKEVVEFARHAFKVDDVKRCRLPPAELAEYNRALDAARAEGSWAWYGLTVYELSRLHPYLPEPENEKLMYTEPGQLPEPYHARFNPKKGFGGRPRLASAGKWPEFPLEVLRAVPLFGKAASNPPPLGPARLGDFKPTVREFAAKELLPKMTRDEKRELERLEGKWPDYPQKFLSFANKHNLPVPGVTLPGPPKKWEAIYDIWHGAKP